MRYTGFYFEKHTLKRATVNFLSTLLVLLLLLSNAQLSVVQIHDTRSSFYFDIRGMFVLLIISWLLVTSKTVYEIVEIKFISKRKEVRADTRTIEKVRGRMFITCPNCHYMCEKRWKKCPICDSLLYRH